MAGRRVSAPDPRATFAATMRALADLAEQSEEIPLPFARIHFAVAGATRAAQAMADAAAALKGPWETGITSGGAGDRLELSASPGGVTVVISARAAQVCTRDAAPGSLGWVLLPEITAVLEPEAADSGEGCAE